MDLFYTRLSEWVVKHSALVLVLSLLIVIGSAMGLKPLIDDYSLDYRVLFSEKNPQFRAFLSMEDTYGKRDNIMIVLEPDNGNVFTKTNLAAIQKLTEAAWETPYSKRVDSLTNFQRSFGEEDELIVEDLVPENIAQLTPEKLQKIQDYALSEPMLVNRMVSKKSHVTAVNIMMNLPSDAGQEQFEAVDFVRALIEKAKIDSPGTNFYLTGETMMGHAAVEAGMFDGQTLFPLMYGLVLVLCFFLLRSFVSVITVLAVIALSTISALGMSGHLGLQLSMITAVVPVIILTLAVADSVHVLVSMLQELRAGVEKRQAIVNALSINHQPIALTSLTTAIGFLALNTSEIPPFRDMGNMVAVGITFAWLFSVFTLPALLNYMPLKSGKEEQKSYALMDKFADLSVKFRNEFAVGFLLVTLFMGYATTLNGFNDLFPEMYGKQITFRQDTDFIRKNLTGVMQIHHSVKAGGENQIFDPDYLAQLDRLADWYQDQPGVLHVEAYSDIIKRLNRSMHGEDKHYYRTPDNRELASQYELLFEMSLPYGLDVSHIITTDRSATRLTVTMDNMESKDIVALGKRGQTFAAENLPALEVVEGVGPSIMLGHAAVRNGYATVSGFALALLSIAVILMISFRSVKLGMLSLIPNLAPGLFAFGVWGMIDGKLGISAAPAVLIALGIVVDDTIHFMSKYLRSRRSGHSTNEAIHYSFRRTGSAIGINCVILIAGFLVLTLSALAPNKFMGLMTALSLLFSLGLTYFLLPTLLKFADNTGEEKTLEASVENKEVEIDIISKASNAPLSEAETRPSN